ncbi:MAG: LptF/LptG family permease [Cyclobacteriaceae bacterium]
MKILDWYILKKFLSTFIYVVIILVMIICVIDYTEKNDDFMKNNVPGAYIREYYLTFIPYMTALLTPIIAFIATVFVTAKLAAKTEIVAILASGVSFRRIMLPYLVGATMVAILSFYLNGWVIPDANKFRINFEILYTKKPFYFSTRDIHMKIGPNDYLYMNRYNNQRDQGYQVTLEHIADGELKAKLQGRTMQWDTSTHKWKIKMWQLREFEETSEVVSNGEAMDTTLILSPKDFRNQDRRWETLRMDELREHIKLLEDRGSEDVIVYRIERYIRYMSPFTIYILMFIGLIVSSRKNRRGTGFQIALGFLIAFGFIIFFILARALAEANSIHPIFAVWLPNIMFTGVGLIMYKTVPR